MFITGARWLTVPRTQTRFLLLQRDPRPGETDQQEGQLDIGSYVIVRSSPSGVWAGTLASIHGQTVELTDARRLWRWWAGKGVSLSGVATHGLRADKLDECRISTAVDRALIFEVCEILSTSPAARASIEAQKAVAA